MIVEVTFWIVVIAATRKLGKVYARSGDVLYGPYMGQQFRSTTLKQHTLHSKATFAHDPFVNDLPFFVFP